MSEDPFKKPSWVNIVGFPFADALRPLTPDEYAAHVFLWGWERKIVPPGPAPKDIRRNLNPYYVDVAFLKGNDEEKGRQALIRVLHDGTKPVPAIIRDQLAALLSGDDERRLEIVAPRGHHSSSQKDRAIADFVERRTRKYGGKQEPAIEEAIGCRLSGGAGEMDRRSESILV